VRGGGRDRHVLAAAGAHEHAQLRAAAGRGGVPLNKSSRNREM